MGQFSSTAFAKNGISHILLKEALENELLELTMSIVCQQEDKVKLPQISYLKIDFLQLTTVNPSSVKRRQTLSLTVSAKYYTLAWR